MKTQIRLTITPDNQPGGVSYHIERREWNPEHEGWEPWDSLDSGGWAGSGPRGASKWVIRWRDYARRRLALPAAVRKARQGWGDAVLSPFGWSPGGNAAPQGAILTWTI